MKLVRKNKVQRIRPTNPTVKSLMAHYRNKEHDLSGVLVIGVLKKKGKSPRQYIFGFSGDIKASELIWALRGSTIEIERRFYGDIS